MFATGVDVPSFAPNDVSNDMNNFSFDGPHTEEDFDLGLDSLLDDSFPMMDMEGHLTDTFDIEEDVTNDTVFVNRPQEMNPKPAISTKRQSFKVPQRSRKFVRFPMIFICAENYAERMKNAGNIFLSSSGSATLDMYSASVRAFLSGVDKEVQEERMSEKWKESGATGSAAWFVLPVDAGTDATYEDGYVPIDDEPKVSSTALSAELGEHEFSNLASRRSQQPRIPSKGQGWTRRTELMQRAGEVLRGADVPKDENPLEKLPRGSYLRDATCNSPSPC